MEFVKRFATVCRTEFDRRTERDPSLIVGVLAAIAMAAGWWASHEAWQGCSPHPFEFLDLELTFSPQLFWALLAQASGCHAGVVWSFVSWDVIFPITYATFLSALYLWAGRCRRVLPSQLRESPHKGESHQLRAKKVRGYTPTALESSLIVLPFVCAAFDIFSENLPLFYAALRPHTPFASVAVMVGSIGSALKWTLLSLFAIGLLDTLLRDPRGTVLWRIRFSVLAVALGGLPLLVLPQGQDIIIRLVEGNAPWIHMSIAVAFLAITALVSWYTARTLMRVEPGHTPQARTDPWVPFFERNIPRMVGIALPLTAAAAFAKAGFELGWFAAITILTYLAVTAIAARFRPFVRAIGRLIARVYLAPEALDGNSKILQERTGQAAIAIVLSLSIVWPVKVRPLAGEFDASRETHALRLGAALLVMVAWILYMFVYFRRQVTALKAPAAILATAAGRPDARDVAIADDTMPVDPPDPRSGKERGIAIFAAAVSALFFVTFTAFPVSVGRALGPIPVLCISAANAVFVGSLLAWLGRKYRVPFVAILLALAAVFSLWNDNHAIRTIPRIVRTGVVAVSPALRARLTSWLTARAAEDTARDSTIPLILVATAGGGLRAGYWTLASLAALQDRDTMFTRHLFAISGVSGGSVGAAMFAAMMRDRDAVRGCGFEAEERAALAGRPATACARRLMRDDFLSPLLAMFLGSDVLQTFLPFPVPWFDRSRALEGSFARSYSASLGRSTLDSGFLAFRAESLAALGVPTLLLNTTHVETGRRYITAPFPIDSIFRDALSVTDVLRADLSLATAAHNSARFPYVSPAGRIARDSGGHYGSLVDGGYFEASGLATLNELRRELDRLLTSQSDGRLAAAANRVRIVVVYLCNDPEECKREERGTLPVEVSRTSLGEWLTPLRALLNARDARGSLARADAAQRDAELTRRDAGRLIQLSVCDSLAPFTFGDSAVADSARRTFDRSRVVNPPLGWLLSQGARTWMDRSLVLDTAALNVDSLAAAGNCRLRNTRALDAVHGARARIH